MIVATLASYPGRLELLDPLIDRVAPQVDVMNVILNEFAELPDIGRSHENVNLTVPDADTKDTGKFLIPVGDDDWLFTIDDDIIYPPDYVAMSIAKMEGAPGDHVIGGYHGSIYTKHPRLNSRWLRRLLNRSPNFIVCQRDVMGLQYKQEAPVYVDQLGTGVAFMKGRDAPPFKAITHGQQFVDIAAARYWYETGKKLICFDREAGWLSGHDTSDDNIELNFTERAHTHVADEIYHFAYRRPYVGQTPPR